MGRLCAQCRIIAFDCVPKYAEWVRRKFSSDKMVEVVAACLSDPGGDSGGVGASGEDGRWGRAERRAGLLLAKKTSKSRYKARWTTLYRDTRSGRAGGEGGERAHAKPSSPLFLHHELPKWSPLLTRGMDPAHTESVKVQEVGFDELAPALGLLTSADDPREVDKKRKRGESSEEEDQIIYENSDVVPEDVAPLMVWIDTPGSEGRVLKGMKRFLRALAKRRSELWNCLVVRWSGGVGRRDFFEDLERWGWRANRDVRDLL